MDPFSFKALVPEDMWVAPRPMLTRFNPGHDHRILTTGASNDTTIDVSLEFNTEMACESVTASITLNMTSSDHDLFPRIKDGSVTCQTIDGINSTFLSGDVSSSWQWSATLSDVPDGIIEIVLTRPNNVDYSDSTHSVDRLLLRKGSSHNVMVFQDEDYDKTGAFTRSGGKYAFAHQAKGADLFRYSWNFGKNYTRWTPYEDVTTIPAEVFDNCIDCFWQGNHIIVQCKLPPCFPRFFC
jgi:alpha-1,3-glucan synthase